MQYYFPKMVQHHGARFDVSFLPVFADDLMFSSAGGTNYSRTDETENFTAICSLVTREREMLMLLLPRFDTFSSVRFFYLRTLGRM